ncbi:hypothetical protein UT300012_22000 [Paraclostridium bifermentans]
MRNGRFANEVNKLTLKMLVDLFEKYDFRKIYNIVGEELSEGSNNKFDIENNQIVLDIEGHNLFYVRALSKDETEQECLGLKLKDRFNYITIHLEFDKSFKHIRIIGNVRGCREYLDIYNMERLEIKDMSLDYIDNVINNLDTLVTGVHDKYDYIENK